MSSILAWRIIAAPPGTTFGRRVPNSMAKENELRLVMRLRSDGRLCGGIGLHPQMEHRRAELGYWIGVPYWRNGYATEAAQAVVRHGLEQFKLNCIFAAHFKQNVA